MWRRVPDPQDLVLATATGFLRLRFREPSMLRVVHGLAHDGAAGDWPGNLPDIIEPRRGTPGRLREDDGGFLSYSSGDLEARVDLHRGVLEVLNADGRLLFRERDRVLAERPVHTHRFAEARDAKSIDGARRVRDVVGKDVSRTAREASVTLELDAAQSLYGLGSHEEGHGSLRGKTREVFQHNLKACVPALVSSAGYGLMFATGSAMTFEDDVHGTRVWMDCVDHLEYFVVHGGDFEGVCRGWRRLCGPAPLLPRWAFGYIQSKERYVNAREMLEVAREYRRRSIPLDAVVLDWRSWPETEENPGWGQKSFDPARFPNPEEWIRDLHAEGARLMVSVWPVMTGDGPDLREMRENGFLLENDANYNPFDPGARELYWRQAGTGLFSKGVDAWWTDCTEPFEADWKGPLRPPAPVRMARNLEPFHQFLDPARANLYSYYHSKGVFEGQRGSGSPKRVLNLTRSSFFGQHCFGTVTWSGDTSATWATLRQSIAECLHFCATGEPYWTCDIGAFFIQNRPGMWFWNGEFEGGCRGLTTAGTEPDPADTGCTDLGYHELYARWCQFAVFLPMFRSHGTDAPREIWRFGEAGDPVYDAIAGAIRLRYRLLPTLYSLAADAAMEGVPMLRPPALAFPEDSQLAADTASFLLGPSLLVVPVTRPMWYGPGSRKLDPVDTRVQVYLPAGRSWMDFHTGIRLEGGRTHSVDAPLDRIPLFVAEGAVLIFAADPGRNADETLNGDLEVHLFPGADGAFRLYEDAGDGYGYEQGEFSRIRFEWDESSRTFTAGGREGRYPGMPETRNLRILLHSKQGVLRRELAYSGAALSVTSFETDNR